MNKKSTLALAVSALLAGHCGIAFADLESVRTFDIPPQPLASALLQFSSQADVQVVGSSNSLTDLATPGINGRYTGSEALRRLIGGNPVNFEAVTKRSVRILPQAEERAIKRDVQLDRQTSSERFQRTSVETSASLDSNSSATSTLRLAQGVMSEEGEKGGAEESESTVRLEEVIVTGSHIRGAQNLSSPVITFDREYIERSGYATTQQFFQSLPQNLNSVSDTTLGNINGGSGSYDTYDGSAINLRGLGGDATLVLLNGRRLAAAGNGSFVDLSLIPLSAVERIDVLTDGASAIYGSDAVGGVVNIVLRHDFEGAETRLRYGSVTDGSHDEQQVGQMLGHAWSSGHALVSYEYFGRTKLDGADREFFHPSMPFESIDLIPEQSRHGALAMFRQALSDGVELSSDLFYGQRESVYTYSIGAPYDNASDVHQYGASLGLNVDVTRDWQLRLTGLFDQNDSELQLIDGATGGQLAYYGNESRLWSLDVAADGSLMSAPGGDVRLAVGGHVRREEFLDENPVNPGQLERDIAAIYAEALIPWIGATNRRTGIDRLELTLAARYEDYSDFGRAFNPKVGIAWAPIRGLNVRGTWGTSFKAPLLTQLNLGSRSSTIYVDRFHDVRYQDVPRS